MYLESTIITLSYLSPLGFEAKSDSDHKTSKTKSQSTRALKRYLNDKSLIHGRETVIYFWIKAWFPYDCWQSFTITGIASKLFSNCNDHMDTKLSFYQQLPTIPATANDRNDHDHWDRIRVYLCNHSDHERSSAIAKS